MNRPAVTRALRRVFLLIWVPASVWALDTDREQPIQITADIAIRDEVAGETRYEGNVIPFRAHSKLLLIRCPYSMKAVTRTDYCHRPARLIQQPAPGVFVDASALRIEYIRSKDLVRLLDDARIAQNGSTLSGDQIEYLVVRSVERRERLEATVRGESR